VPYWLDRIRQSAGLKSATRGTFSYLFQIKVRLNEKLKDLEWAVYSALQHCGSTMGVTSATINTDNAGSSINS
jgi:hypothetical protein